MAQLLPGTPIEIASDASLKPGDVIFETAHGQLDASVSTQLREIERGLADRVNL
jgi:flagellar biosynthesis/type III secretory pathway protein FliH